jgi:hypothetical protein
MKKPWSVATTMRSPERLIGILKVLTEIDGWKWDDHTQELYQIMLIQHREYGFGESQFYAGLPRNIVDLISDTTKEIPFDTADMSMRARLSALFLLPSCSLQRF